jgi:hypothetical protein
MAFSVIELDELELLGAEDELVVEEDEELEPASVLPPQAVAVRATAAAATVRAIRGFMSAFSLCGDALLAVHLGFGPVGRADWCELVSSHQQLLGDGDEL